MTKNCPLCASPSRTPYKEHKGHRLFRCDACRLVYLDPPPAAHLNALYDDAFEGGTTGYFKKAPAKLMRARRTIRRIVQALGRPAAGLTFLDIGANGGFMTEAAREAGFEAVGIEPDRGALRYARTHFPQNAYIGGFLETTALGGRQFDVVHCSEVIEHSSDLQRFAAHLAGAVKPGGLLYLTTPYLDHWRRPREVTEWDGFKPPEHCLYFDPKNLAQLLAQHGLRVFRQRFAWKPGIKVFARKAA
ncbi:MAG: class I SAM-dependent methyltransferase [Alphaproteobacteria bacterium]